MVIAVFISLLVHSWHDRVRTADVNEFDPYLLDLKSEREVAERGRALRTLRKQVEKFAVACGGAGQVSVRLLDSKDINLHS